MAKHLLLFLTALISLTVPFVGRGQCVFTSTAVGGPFTSPSTWIRSGTGCGSNTIPTVTSVIIVNGPVQLNTNFALTGNGGTLLINSGGSLIEDGTRRTLTLGSGSGSEQLNRATVSAGGNLIVSELDLTKSRLNVATGGNVTVQCNLTLNNQGSAEINGAVVVNGNLTLTTGNPVLQGTGSLLIRGCVTGTNGALQNAIQGGLIVCVRNGLTACGSGTCNGNIPINNDANCQAIDPQPLPVELTSFRAGASAACVCVRLTWQTASEHGAKTFLIERSANGRDFGIIGEVSATGTSTTTSTYAWQDERPLTGQSYYRLRQVDSDGSFTRSASVSVLTALPVKNMTLWPATTAGYYEVSALGTPVTLTVLTPDGRSVRTQTLPEGGGQLNLVGCPAGLYLVRAVSAQGATTTRIAHVGQ